MGDAHDFRLEGLTSQALLETFTAQIMSKVKETVRKSKNKLKRDIAHLQSGQADLSTQKDLRIEAIESRLSAIQETVSVMETEKQRQKTVFGNHINSVSEVNLKIDKFSEDVGFIRNSIVDLSTEMMRKASITDLATVSEQLSTLCPREFVEDLDKEVHSRALQMDLDAVSHEIRSFRERVPIIYAEKEPIWYEIRRIDEKYENSLKQYVSSQYFTRVHMEMQKTLDLIRNKVEEFTGEFRKKNSHLKEELAKIKGEIDNKATITQIHDIRRVLAICATVSQVESLSSEVKTCQSAISAFKSQLNVSLQAQDQVLQRYDEMFLEKASKFDVKELDLKLKAVFRHIDFEKRVDGIEENVGKCVEFIEKYTGKMEEIMGKVDHFGGIVKGLKSEKREIAVIKANLQEIMENLHSKAEKYQISELIDCKASSEEVRSISKAIGGMYRLDKLTLVLLQHTIKYLNSPREAKSLEFGSVQWLLKHAELVSSWATVYQPIQNEVDCPVDLASLQWCSKPDKTPTSPTMRTPTAGMALLTPTRKSRPLTPNSFGRTVASLASTRRVAQRFLVQRPSLDGSLFR